MPLSSLPGIRWLGVHYAPRPEERPFMERVQVQRDDAHTDGQRAVVVLSGTATHPELFGWD